VLEHCDACSELWNNGNDVDEDRDMVDYGICSSSSRHGEHPAQHDVNVRFYVSRPQTVEMAGLLGGGVNEHMTSSRDLLVATDTVIGQHVGDHDNNNNNNNNNNSDDDDDDDEN